jgi:hypothetical protein
MHYNVTLRRVHEITVAIKSNVLHISMCARASLYVDVDVGAQALACASGRVALLIQHATRRHIAICSLSGSTILSHKRHDFRKNITEHKTYINFLYNFYLIHFLL